MEKLVGTDKSSGQFVLDGQVLAVEEGFSHVNKSWFSKCISIDDGINQVMDEQREMEDLMVEAGKLDFKVVDGKFVSVIDGREFIPTEKALMDIARWCDQTSQSFVKRITSPALKQNGKVDYERDDEDSQTLVSVLKNGKRRIDPNKKFLFRTYGDGSLRCMLSDSYAIINNVWYLDILKETVPGGVLSHWRGNGDNIYGNLLIPDTIREEQDSDFAALISLSNGETGERRLGNMPSLFRAICFNGNIWGRTNGEAINQVHKGKIDLVVLRKKIMENITEQIPLSIAAIDRFLDTRNKKVASVGNIFAQIAIDYKQSYGKTGEIGRIMDEFVEYESGDKNLYGIINAITRYSQKTDNKRWVELDTLGGTLMSLPDNKWEHLVDKSRTIDSETLELVLGI